MGFQKINLKGFESDKPLIIAGPCSAESEAQVMEAALSIAQLGIPVFRAGVWKPRTRPGCFEGRGEEALPWLVRVREETGMAVTTEVANARHVEAALKAGIDLLWIGARTTVNPFAVQEIADALRGVDIPVLIKNPINPDIELWSGAIQRFLNAGITRLGAVHRGFSTYGDHYYRYHPQWYIPIELRRRYPDLPILCDPSHMGGRRELILPLSQEALDMGFEGLMIEVHSHPESALSDASQQITPQMLQTEVLQRLELRRSEANTGDLTSLRREMDIIDEQIFELLGQRMELSRHIGNMKRVQRIAVVQPKRFDEIMKRLIETGHGMGMSESFVHRWVTLVHEESVRQQTEGDYSAENEMV